MALIGQKKFNMSNNTNKEKQFLHDIEKEERKYGERQKHNKMVPYKRDNSKQDYYKLIEEDESDDNFQWISERVWSSFKYV